MTAKVLLNPDDPTDPYQMYGVGPVPPKKPGTIRIWVDGCFDMLHFGHTNAIRQAASLGAELFVGCHSDEEIIKYKGPPIMHADERYEALRACKWVTYVVENYPYCTRLKDIERFEVDFVAHGDDISVDLNGRNSYQEIIDAGKFKVVKRTDGISTTDLVGRMLLCTKNHMLADPDQVKLSEAEAGDTSVRYMTTTSKLIQFSNNRTAKPTDKVVYVDGSFDLFHIGHMRILEAARKLGTFVIAGIHEDKVINEKKGKNYPIMNLNERILGVLSCRYVDEVIMGVPFNVTKEVIESNNVQVVVAGMLADERQDSDTEGSGATSPSSRPIRDPYAVPRAMGILVQVDSNCDLTTDSLIERVLLNRQAFLERQASKKKKDKKSEEMKPEEYRNVREVC